MVAVSTEKWAVHDEAALDDDEPQCIQYDIASYPTDFTVQVLYEKWQNEQLVIPDFQRGYVWTLTQASRFIESFLLGLPVPQVFLYRRFSSPEMIVVDGQQRLATIAMFYDGTFLGDKPFKLRGVNEEWVGKTYEDLGEDDRYRLDDSTLRAIVVRQIQPQGDSSIYQIFERLNTGGTRLNAMEIRKALYHGYRYNLLKYLNENQEWRKLIGNPTADKRLRDVELVLRVLALASGDYTSPMKSFLTDYMEGLPGPESEEHERIRRQFSITCDILHENLGEKPFHIYTTLNAASLDAVMVTVMKFNDNLCDDLKSCYESLRNDHRFRDAITDHTSHASVVRARLDAAEAMLVKRS